MSLKGEDALILAQDYVDETLKGAGALKGQDGKDGVSPVISVNTSTSDTYKLDITDKNGTITTPNLVGKQGLQGIQGEQGKPADNPIITENVDNTEDVYKLDLTVGETVFTTKNIIGKQGLEGVSPSVTTNPDNTAEDYRLNITTKGGTFTTPNLRGPQGEIGPQGESAASAINPRGDYDVNADPHYTVSDYITSAEGNTYVCKKDNPGNVAPTDGTVNDEFWQVLALRGAKGEAGKDGEKGADGVTFTPSIDESGVLSFTNNGGLENPEPIDIKGDNGVTFTPSIDADGYLSFTNDGNLENPEPIKVFGKDGVDGKDGIDGTTYIPSIGTVTTVESNADASVGVTVDEETKEAVFNFAIPKGENGAEGFSPIVTITETDNGHNVAIEDANGVKNFEVLNGKDAEQRVYTSLTELGLTAPVTVGDIFNAMPNKTIAVIACEGREGNTEGAVVHVSDVPVSFGVLTIKKNEKGRFSIEYQNSLQGSPCDVKRWIGTLQGLDGTRLYWKQLSAEPTFVTLNDIGLTADATFQDVVDALPKGGSALLGVKEFTNYQTMFPYEEGNDQFARVHIVKGLEDGSCVYARWFRKDGVKETIAIFNINDNKFNGWQKVATKSIYNSVAELNKAKGKNIELVNGADNTKKIVDALSVGEQFISFYHNNANQNRFGIDVSYGNLIHELRITKCLDADLTANYATVTAFMNTGCVLSRIYYKTYSTAWSSTKDYVESLTK